MKPNLQRGEVWHQLSVCVFNRFEIEGVDQTPLHYFCQRLTIRESRKM